MLKKTRRVVLLLIMLLIACSAESVSAKIELPDAVKTVASAQYFSTGYNGFIAHKSAGEQALRMVVSSPDATRKLLNIARFSSTTLAGRLYAACGLKQQEYSDMDIIFTPFFHFTVSVLRGDVLTQESFQDLYGRIAAYGCN
ncbi:hypothetical protein AB3X31_14715 [Raoultella terrigena]|uniref:hypothetical protein n=1 Tax=Raoultella terrigena TaxID=577 RepID=UPI000F4CA574|nr:hypothetical protein [Raoultella terrigena]